MFNENYEYLSGDGSGGGGPGSFPAQLANTFFSGPTSGAAATPTFRTISLADLAAITAGSTAGQALISQGPGATPMFATVSGGGGSGMFQQVFTGAGQTHTMATGESGTRYVLTGSAASALNITLASDSSAASPYKWSVYNASGADGSASGGTLTVSIPTGYTVQHAGASYTTSIVSSEKGAALTFENIVNTSIYMLTNVEGTWTGN